MALVAIIVNLEKCPVMEPNNQNEKMDNDIGSSLAQYNFQIDYDDFLSKIKTRFESHNIRRYSENHSISFGYHFYDTKFGKSEYLKYNLTKGFFISRNAFNSINSGDKLYNFVKTRQEKYEIPKTNHTEYVLSVLKSIDDFYKLRKFLNRNICNQQTDIGNYSAFRNDNSFQTNKNYHIHFDPYSNSNADADVIFDYFVVTACEAFFVDPYFLGDIIPQLEFYKTWMGSQPTYLTSKYPVGDIFIILTYDEKKINSKDLILSDSEISKNKQLDKLYKDLFESEFSQYLQNELHSLCRISYFENLLRKQSTKSAIAANMSRNMSHNWGSHSLVHLGNKDVLENYQKPKQLFLYGEINKEIKREIKDFAEKLAIYNNNLRIRMDLIADIVTSVPVSENTRWLYKDVLAKYVSNQILADTISGSSNFRYELTSADSDIEVSIPNDILGMDTFGILIENIVRNCAKHGNKEGKVKLVIHIEDGELFNIPEFYKITIHQDCPEITSCTFDSNSCPIVCKRRIDINKPVLDAYNKLRVGAWGILEMKIASAYLRKIPAEEMDNPEYKLEIGEDGRWENLDGYDPKNCIHETPLILTANCCENVLCETEKGLGYSFFLMKPKEVLIFDYDNKINLEPKSETNLLNKGIRIIRGQSTIEELIRTNIFNHKILLCFSNNSKKTERARFLKSRKIAADEKKITVDYSTNLPNRIIWVNPENFESTKDQCKGNNECLIHCLKTGQTDCFIKKCWEIWTDVLIDKLKKREKCDCFSLNNFKFPDIENTSSSTFKILIPGNAHNLKLKKDKKEFCYIDIDSGFSVSKLPFGGLEGIKELFKNGNKKYCFEMVSLFESFVNRIGIIDERIQDFAYNSKYTVVAEKEEIWYYQYFNKMNIHIPYKSKNINNSDKELGINLSNTDYNSDSLKKYILRWVKTIAPKLDFLLIHMGIIEKLCGNTSPDILRNYFEENILNKAGKCKIIIISGRGKPHNIPLYTRFLNYSQIAAYLCDNQSKYMLHDLCTSARTIQM